MYSPNNDQDFLEMNIENPDRKRLAILFLFKSDANTLLFHSSKGRQRSVLLVVHSWQQLDKTITNNFARSVFDLCEQFEEEEIELAVNDRNERVFLVFHVFQ